MPSAFGFTNPTPTPEADIYAFGLVIFLVSDNHSGCLPLAYTVQVLTGQIPFRGAWIPEFGFSVFRGLRPGKPANASTIGFSDSLWDFTQRCWDGDMNSRPKVSEVVTHLAKAAAGWHGLMPPCSQTVDTVCVSGEQISDLVQQHRTFVNLTSPPPRSYLSGDNTGDIFEPQSTDSGSPSTVFSEPLTQEFPVTLVRPPTEPPPDRLGTLSRRPQEAPDGLQEFPHVGQNFRPPPPTLPPPKWRPLQRFKDKLRWSIGRPRATHDH
jgi:hypothetical protein